MIATRGLGRNTSESGTLVLFGLGRPSSLVLPEPRTPDVTIVVPPQKRRGRVIQPHIFDKSFLVRVVPTNAGRVTEVVPDSERDL